MDPVDQISISNYAAFGLNPNINVDKLGNSWVNSKKSGTVWDTGVKFGDDSKAKEYYGDDATILDYGEYESTTGKGKFTLKPGGEWVGTDGITHIAEDQHYVNENYIKRRTWLENFLIKGDEYFKAGGKANVMAYKIGAEYNPIAQAVTNSFSSILGRDATIPEFDMLYLTGGDISGEKMTLNRRVTTGINGATGFATIFLGGFGVDFSVNMLVDNVSNNSNNTLHIKNSIAVTQYLWDIKKLNMSKTFTNSQLLNPTSELVNSVLNNASGAADNSIKEKVK